MEENEARLADPVIIQDIEDAPLVAVFPTAADPADSFADGKWQKVFHFVPDTNRSGSTAFDHSASDHEDAATAPPRRC